MNKDSYANVIASLGAIQCFPDGKSLTKEQVANLFFNDFTQVCLSMFEWKNLPKEIPQEYLNLYLQLFGRCVFTKQNGKYYVLFGNLGGSNTPQPCTPYYIPKGFVVANPYIPLTKTLQIGKDCVLLRADYLRQGLAQWNSYYAYQRAEAYRTMRIGLINARAEFVLSTDDDNSTQGAKEFFKAMEKGESPSYIVHNNFLSKDALTSVQLSNGSINAIRSAVETAQYLFSQWARGVGLSASFNTKREYVSDKATTTADDLTIPRAEQMLKCLQQGADEINALYGLNVSVDYSNVWKFKFEEKEAETEIVKNEAKNPQTSQNPQNKPQEAKEPEEGNNTKEDKNEQS